jgi:hypothetical protein
LVFAGLVGSVAAGCGTSGASNQVGSLPNGNGGGTAPYTNVPTSAATAAPFSIKPVLIDSGAEETPGPTASPSATPANTYKGILGTSATDAPNTTTQPAADPLPPSAPPDAPKYPVGDGSHIVTFKGNGLTQQTFQFSKVVPDLVYQVAASSPAGAAPTFFTDSTIVAHLAYVPSTATPPGTLASVAIEIAGSNAAGSFDVRVTCTSVPLPAVAITPASFTKITCPKFPALAAIANTVGPNPVLPGSVLGYDPVAAFSPKLNILLLYTAPVPTTSTGNVLGISDIYATQ